MLDQVLLDDFELLLEELFQLDVELLWLDVHGAELCVVLEQVLLDGVGCVDELVVLFDCPSPRMMTDLA